MPGERALLECLHQFNNFIIAAEFHCVFSLPKFEAFASVVREYWNPRSGKTTHSVVIAVELDEPVLQRFCNGFRFGMDL